MTLKNPTGIPRAQSNEVNPNHDSSYKLEFISWDSPMSCEATVDWLVLPKCHFLFFLFILTIPFPQLVT